MSNKFKRERSIEIRRRESSGEALLVVFTPGRSSLILDALAKRVRDKRHVITEICCAPFINWSDWSIGTLFSCSTTISAS